MVATKSDVVSSDEVVVGITSGEILAPADVVELVLGVRIEEWDEDLLAGFDWGRHDTSSGG